MDTRNHHFQPYIKVTAKQIWIVVTLLYREVLSHGRKGGSWKREVLKQKGRFTSSVDICKEVWRMRFGYRKYMDWETVAL